jgi:threonine/homoserine/homoserine lactone efflux protein
MKHFEQRLLKNISSIAVLGAVISLVGALPLGTLNVTAAQISAQQGLASAIAFAIAVVIVEMLYAYLCAVAGNLIGKNVFIKKYLPIAAIAILVFFALSYFRQAYAMHNQVVAPKDYLTQQPFLLGLLLSAINPMQFPYWISWSLMLQQRSLLQASFPSRLKYILGIGSGTLIALAIFIAGGRQFSGFITQHQAWINIAIGAIFLISALMMLKQFLATKQSS